MNIDLVLKEASWPSLLVDSTGTIKQSNAAAATTFGPEHVRAGAQLGSLLATANEPGLSIEQLLSAAGSRPWTQVTLRIGDGQAGRFLGAACRLEGGARDPGLFLVQLAPASATPGGAAAVKAAAASVSDPAGAASEAAQKQKLECALQLTRTVALDFNNALTSILGHTSLVLGKMPADHPWRSSLIEVEKSAEKAAEIASDLASFSRQERDTRAGTGDNLNQLVRRTVELFRSSGSPEAKWEMKLEGKLYAVSMDEAKLQQAFVKILDNAIQARGTNRHITITSGNKSVEEATYDGCVTINPGDYVFVEIADNGMGIAPEVLPRIFEPFFTTKDGHRGLGLAWVYGIVTNHAGLVSVSSHAGHGTAVTVYLPATRRIVSDHAASAEGLTGDQTILIVDDEDLLLTMGQMILSEFGYQVLTANDGRKALELFRKPGPKIDLVITDLVMPNMSGRELIESLRKLAPGIRVLCTSGYDRGAQLPSEPFYLQKPYTSQQLLTAVKEVLARKG